MSESCYQAAQTTHAFMLPTLPELLLADTDQPVGVKDPSVSGAFLRLLIELLLAMYPPLMAFSPGLQFTSTVMSDLPGMVVRTPSRTCILTIPGSPLGPCGP